MAGRGIGRGRGGTSIYMTYLKLLCTCSIVQVGMVMYYSCVRCFCGNFVEYIHIQQMYFQHVNRTAHVT